MSDGNETQYKAHIRWDENLWILRFHRNALTEAKSNSALTIWQKINRNDEDNFSLYIWLTYLSTKVSVSLVHSMAHFILTVMRFMKNNSTEWNVRQANWPTANGTTTQNIRKFLRTPSISERKNAGFQSWQFYLYNQIINSHMSLDLPWLWKPRTWTPKQTHFSCLVSNPKICFPILKELLFFS